MCSLYSTGVNQSTVSVCVLSVSADVSQRELRQRRHLLGTDAVIFVMSSSDILPVQVSVQVCEYSKFWVESNS